MKPRKRIGIIFGSPQTFELQAFKYFVLSLNAIQNFYEFSFPVYSEHTFEDGNVTLSDDDIEKRISDLPEEMTVKYHFVVVIASCKMEGDLFYYLYGDYLVVTTDQWDSSFRPPTVFDYLIYCIITSLMDWECDYDNEAHDDDTVGCIFDYTQEKKDIRSGIMLGYVCEEHDKFISKKVSKEYVKEMKDILSRKWLGKIDEIDSVAFNLKKYFKVDINRDSGFQKGAVERMKDTLLDVPGSAITNSILAVVGAIVIYLLSKIGLPAGGN